ncbi:Spermidine N(1)-acetyltransferase [compost metagenome]
MDSEVLIQSHSIQFRKTMIMDLDYVINAENDEESRNYVAQWSREKHIAAIESRDQLHIVIENLDGEKIGYMILAGLTNDNDCIELTRINISHKGQGYGKQSIRLIQKFVFHHLNAHRLWLDVKDFNDRAKYVYESSGFIVEGLLRECIKKNNTYDSLFIMGILRDEYLKLVEG